MTRKLVPITILAMVLYSVLGVAGMIVEIYDYKVAKYGAVCWYVLLTGLWLQRYVALTREDDIKDEILDLLPVPVTGFLTANTYVIAQLVWVSVYKPYAASIVGTSFRVGDWSAWWQGVFILTFAFPITALVWVLYYKGLFEPMMVKPIKSLLAWARR